MAKRTTYTPDPDIAAVIEHTQRELNVGPSEAINTLIRRGLTTQPSRPRRFHQRSQAMGARVSVDNIGAVLSMLDET